VRETSKLSLLNIQKMRSSEVVKAEATDVVYVSGEAIVFATTSGKLVKQKVPL
jgi:hypothetical protein